MAKAASRSAGGSKKSDPSDAIVDAFMKLAADKSVGSIGLGEIAEEAGVTLAELRTHYSSKMAIIAAFVRRVDLAILAEGPADTDSSPRDRLFEVIMRRFDALLPHKDAIARMARSAACDPGFALCLRQMGLRSHRWTLAAAGISSGGVLGRIRVNGVMLAYGEAMRVWLKGDDPDFARTMAALDKALLRGERAMRMVQKACAFVPRFPDRRFDDASPDERAAA